jgi:hypothetical protein
MQPGDNSIRGALVGGGVPLIIAGIPLVHMFDSWRAGTYSCRGRGKGAMTRGSFANHN